MTDLKKCKQNILQQLSESQSQRQSSFPFPICTENAALSIRSRFIYIAHGIAYQVNLHPGEQIGGLQYYVYNLFLL